MSDLEKEELKIKLLFLVVAIMFVGVLYLAFKVITLNNTTTVWMLEHGGLK